MSSSPFHIFPASTGPIPAPSSTSFSLSPPFNAATDIWRKPANPVTGKEVRTFNAPIVYKKVPIGKFRRVRVTIRARWERLYDQGGLVMVLPGEGCEGDNINEPNLKWIKAGIEYYQSQPYVGHVACESWADWSLTQAGIKADKSITIEMEKDPEAGTLWVYSIGEGGTRFPIREVTWVFSDTELKGGKGGKEREIWVGAYAATPILEGREGEGDALVVEFEGWELDVDEWMDGW